MQTIYIFSPETYNNDSFFHFVVQPLSASRTHRDPDNWENAINSCNLTIFNADNSNGEHSSKIWQPFVQIMTYPIITKGR